MFDHVLIAVSDLAASERFYRTVLRVLGVEPHHADAEIVEVERFEQQGSEHVQRLTDDLAHLVSSRGMLVVRPVL